MMASRHHPGAGRLGPRPPSLAVQAGRVDVRVVAGLQHFDAPYELVELPVDDEHAAGGNED